VPKNHLHLADVPAVEQKIVVDCNQYIKTLQNLAISMFKLIDNSEITIFNPFLVLLLR